MHQADFAGLLDDGVEARLVIPDADRIPVATTDITSVEWTPFGENEQVLWLDLADGRRLGLVWGFELPDVPL